MTATLLETEGLGRRFGGLSAVEDVSIAVEPGEIRAVIGPNGAGKTTLVGMICGRLRPSAGTVRFEGRDITAMPAWRRVAAGIVYTFQVTSIYGALTVRENVARAARRLSGGQQQMVAMARALASGPRVLLLDEPTEGLQPSLVDRILEAVRELREAGTTLLLVEQKVEAALAVADRIAFIENGRIREHATPESLARDPEPLIRYVGVRRTG